MTDQTPPLAAASGAESAYRTSGEQHSRTPDAAANLNYRTRRVGPIVVMTYDGGMWFRVCGYGLTIQYPAHPDGHVSFSERYGYRKAWHVFGACIKGLRP